MDTKVQRLFRTYQEMDEVYQQLHANNTVNDPYLVKLIQSNQMLTFIGCRHSNDVDDNQNKFIENEWVLFLKNNNKQKIAFCEGGLRPLEKNKDLAIRKYSEPGLLTWLAHKDNIRTVSPEPDETTEIDYLVSKRFNISEIMTYYFGRQMYQWLKRDYKNYPKWESYAERHIASYANLKPLREYNLTLLNVMTMYESIIGIPFNKTDEKSLYEISAPTSNAVSAASGVYRDISLLNAVKEAWDQGSDVFSVYGSGHAIILEKALNSLGK